MTPVSPVSVGGGYISGISYHQAKVPQGSPRGQLSSGGPATRRRPISSASSLSASSLSWGRSQSLSLFGEKLE
jgi:hypothetical protein